MTRRLSSRATGAVSAMGALTILVIIAAVIPGDWSRSASADGELASFTIVAVPDTQIYVQTTSGAEIFNEQMSWVVEQRIARNVVFVTHEGDSAQDPSSTVEWDRIETAFGVLEAASIPYAIAPGNHDINGDGSAPEYDARFGVDRFAGQPWYGGNHAAEGNRSSYQRVRVDGHDLLFVHVRHLENAFGPTGPVLEWVDDVLADHPNHLAFITTHEFTSSDGSVVKPELEAVVAQHCNVAVMFSGHRRGEAGRGSFDDRCGRTVHHVLTNYQFLPGGGQGFLRTVEVDPLTLDASFSVYSPTLDETRTGTAESFEVALAPLELVTGDADCDRQVTVLDALVIAQYTVGNRSQVGSCPRALPGTEITVGAADTNSDGSVDILDALVIAQCTVGIVNVLCP